MRHILPLSVMRSSWHFNPMSHTSGLSWASMFRLYIRSDIMTSRAPNHLLSRCGYDHVSLVPDDIPPLLAEGQSGASQTSEVSLVQIILNAPKSHLLQRLRILLAQLDGHLPGCPATTLGLGQLVGVRLGRPGGLGRQPGPLARRSAHADDALAGPRRPAQEALVQYHLCRRLLASELGVQPAAATNDLYRRIRDGIQAC